MASLTIGGDPEAQEVIQDLARAKSGRTNWESYWEEVVQRVLPPMSQTFNNDLIVTPGQKKDQNRFDGTAEIALYRFAAAMESMLTPRSSRWHGMGTNDPSLNMKPRVRAWFDDTTDKLFKYRYAPQANFASQNHEQFIALGSIGTGCMFIDKLLPKGYRYAQIPVGQIYFRENFQGIINEALRPLKLTARKAVQQFRNLPEEITKAAEANPDQMFDFIHCVKPNENRDPQRKDYRGKAFVSYYVAVRAQMTVLKQGFNTFPFAISRYMTAPGELYGRSPAMQVLTNIKVLNEQKKTVLKQGQRVVDPVLLAHDDGVLDGFSLKPGALNAGAINSKGQRLVDVLPTGNLAIAYQMMDQERKEINAAFMTDLFQIFMDRPQMTAQEVLELAREKGWLISPTMGRQESEYLGVMIEREIDLGMSQGLFMPLPPELIEAGGEYKIIYDSPLSRAQKAEQTAGVMRTVQWAAEVAQLTQNPEPLDHFDFDVIIPELSLNNAVPGRYMATVDKVAAIRQNRAQQTATQQVIDAGPTVAAISKSQGNAIK